MDDFGYKHKINSDTDDEHSYLSNKRYKTSEADENFDPSTSSAARSGDSISYRRQSTKIQSAAKSSPLSSVLLGDMGLGVLDSDESNQSLLIGNAIASMVQQPSSALSMIPSENSNESHLHQASNSPESFIDSELTNSSQQNTPFDTNLLSNDTTNSIATIDKESFHVYQDYTPANLVPCNRTNFAGLIQPGLSTIHTTVTSNKITSCSSSSTEKSIQECSTEHILQPEGRPIRNTTLKQFHTPKTTDNNDEQAKNKIRSPLAAITNSTAFNGTGTEFEAKQMNGEENFFMFQRRDPRHYTGPDNFEKLSDEILLSIFKWLPKKALARCSLVNQRFSRVIQDESLWTRLDLWGKTIQPYAMGRILQRGVIILRLAQAKILEPLFNPVELRKDFISKLQFLDLSMAIIEPDTLVQLLSKCRYLRKLSLENVPINDAVCKTLAQNRKLETLNLAMCTGFTAYGIRKLFAPLKKLNTLNISWTCLEFDALLEFSNNVSEEMLRLNLAGCRKLLSDDILKKIVERCPKLCELDLSDCTSLSSQTIDIVAQLNHLEYLSLSRCYNINVSAYLEINKIKSLTYLDIFGVLSQQALTILMNSFPDLGINRFKHSAVARPTVGTRRTSIWGLRTRD